MAIQSIYNYVGSVFIQSVSNPKRLIAARPGSYMGRACRVHVIVGASLASDQR